MTTIDFFQQLKDLYTAKRQPQEVLADTGVFLAAEAQGEPGGAAFQQRIEALYAVAYTIKFTLKFAGGVDFKVGRLECLYFSDPQQTPMAEWHWRLLIRIPAEVTGKDLAAAKKALREKKGLDTTAVQRIRWREGRGLQMLHVGPYDQVTQTFTALHTHAAQHGLQLQGPAHEIYLSDPRRTAPARLKTIVRLRVRGSAARPAARPGPRRRRTSD